MSDKKTPAPAQQGRPPQSAQSSTSEISAFLDKARSIGAHAGSGRGRLILALDATMSRQPTWDLACSLQARMFDAVERSGGLNVQLVYFRGFGECRSSRFVADTAALKDLMVRIDCRGGHTQIGKVLTHIGRENARERVNAVVYIGDAMEEKIDDLAAKAGELGLRGVPMFLFQEGTDRVAETAFREIARLTKGAWFRFDRNAPEVLAGLLSSIAVFASGGLKALEARGTRDDQRLIENLRGAGQ